MSTPATVVWTLPYVGARGKCGPVIDDQGDVHLAVGHDKRHVVTVRDGKETHRVAIHDRTSAPVECLQFAHGTLVQPVGNGAVFIDRAGQVSRHYASGSGPTLGADGVVFTHRDSRVFAFREGQTLWKLPLRHPKHLMSAPGVLYVIDTDDVGEVVVAVKDGRELWRSDGRADGCGMRGLVAQDGSLLWSIEGGIAALRDGKVVWSTQLPDSRLCGSPVQGPDGTIYVSGRHSVLALRDHDVQWTADLDSKRTRPTSSPVPGPGGAVLVGGWDGKLRALAEGKVLWSLPFTISDRGLAPPAVAPDGMIYVFDRRGLHAIRVGE